MHGAKRVITFCCLTTILPTILIIIPLYLRHSQFADVIYHVAESDIFEIHEGISSIFCQEHELHMNSTFSAYQLHGAPQTSNNRKHIRLKKSMRLPDDTLEYWGFYLLSGATVTLKACSRFEGGRILVVRGERNLRTCGLLEHNQKKGPHLDKEHNQVQVTFENAAQEVVIHKEEMESRKNISKDLNTAEEDLSEDNDEIERLKQLAEKYIEKLKHRNKNLTQEQLLDTTNCEDCDTTDLTTQHNKRHSRRKQELEIKLNEIDNIREKREIDVQTGYILTDKLNRINSEKILNKKLDELTKLLHLTFQGKNCNEDPETIKNKIIQKLIDIKNKEYENVQNIITTQRKNLKVHIKTMLEKQSTNYSPDEIKNNDRRNLNQHLRNRRQLKNKIIRESGGTEENVHKREVKNNQEEIIKHNSTNLDFDLKQLTNIVEEYLSERDCTKHIRNRRHLKERLSRELSEPEIYRAKRETGHKLDGAIGHGGNALNYTDKVSQESQSSFENNLLTCYDGQILVTESFSPSHLCTDVNFVDQGVRMRVSHEVNSDGYYYYIFYSDNDLVSNDIHAVFDIYKPTFQYSDVNDTKQCINQTSCNFSVSFFSGETVIVEIPTRDGIEHEPDDITQLVSVCKPRMMIYMIFPIAILFLILGCAFL